MPHFAANLTMMFTELPFLERFGAAAAAGFEAIEFLLPYDYAKEELADLLEQYGLTLVLHNLPCGNWAGGDRGIGSLPGRIEEFRAGVSQGIEYATALGCRQLNCLAGIPPAGVSPELARATLVDNLRFAAPLLDATGITLLLEPVNSRDVPGFFLDRTRPALDIMAEVGAPNLRLQYDIYHAQVMEGDIANSITAFLDRIGHIQLADNPGRHEPGTGELNYPFLFDLLDELGYAGWVGCEYKPRGETKAGLGWLNPYLSAR